MAIYLWISLGAVLGAVARYLISHWSSVRSAHAGFPYGTLFVNVTGSLLLGWFLAYTHDRAALDSKWRLFVAVGFCGSYTTFSTFSWETVDYLKQGQYGVAALNFMLNNVLCLAAIFAGAKLAGE